MASRIGNSIFFIGLILVALAAIAGMPLAIPIGALALLFVTGGWWLWSKTPQSPRLAVPLSQQPANVKLLAGIPAVACLVLSIIYPQDLHLLSPTGQFLLAYFVAGLVELVIDKQFPGAKKKWDDLASWKKLFISSGVIAISLGLCYLLIRSFA